MWGGILRRENFCREEVVRSSDDGFLTKCRKHNHNTCFCCGNQIMTSSLHIKAL